MNPVVPQAVTITRVAIVEDIAGIRDNLMTLVATSAGLELAGVAGTGEEALEILPALRPDVVLMDIELGEGISGIECVRQLKEILPATEFMMLTVFADHTSVYESLRAGATGYLVKGLAAERLLDSITELRAGGSPMSSSIARRVVQNLIQPKAPTTPESRLSVREEEVLRALAAGQRYKEIADVLGLSVHTVRTHIHRIYQKLHVQNRSEAAAAFRHGGGQK